MNAQRGPTLSSRLLTVTAVGAAVLILVGCPPPAPPGTTTDPSPAVGSVELTSSRALIATGESQRLGVLVRGADGTVLRDVELTWSSSVPTVASAVAGRVEGLIAGTSLITVTSGSHTSAPMEVVVVAVDATTPSSDALIASALRSGRISEEAALTYRVFAAFRDPRLPPELKGNDRAVLETGILTVLGERYLSLSESTQEVLGPFLMHPTEAGSWADPSGVAQKARVTNWPLECIKLMYLNFGLETISSPGSHVKVWYDPLVGDRARAERVSSALENMAWPTLIDGLKFKRPQPDSAATVSPCVIPGGDARLDVFVTTRTGPSFYWHKDHAGAGAGFIVISDTEPDVEAVATHEFMHAVQRAYKTKLPPSAYAWLDEATADWAIDAVYGKEHQLEQKTAHCLLDEPHLSLDANQGTKCDSHRETESVSSGRPYAAYLFFQYLAHTLEPGIVAKVIAARSTTTDGLHAIEAGLEGHFHEEWPKFAKTLWNQEPITTKHRAKSFLEWDDLQLKPKAKEINGDLSGQMEASDALTPEDGPRGVASASIQYYHFTFSDPNTRSLLFNNKLFELTRSGKKVSVQALWRNEDGDWQEEDLENKERSWTDFEFVGLCRDLREQRVTELVVIIANAEVEHGGAVAPAEDPYLKRNNLGCWKYEGTFAIDLGPNSGVWKSATLGGEKISLRIPDESTTLDSKLDQIPNSLRAGLQASLQVEGSYHFTYDNGLDDCHEWISNLQIPLEPSLSAVKALNAFPELKSDEPWLKMIFSLAPRTYTIDLVDGRTHSVSRSGKNCSGAAPALAPMFLLVTHLGAKEDPLIDVPTARTDGQLSGTFSKQTITSTWSLQAQAQP